MLGGFIKGIVVGTLSFVLGFAVLSVVLPVEDAGSPLSPEVSGTDPTGAPTSTPAPAPAPDLVPEGAVVEDDERQAAPADAATPAQPAAPDAAPAPDTPPAADDAAPVADPGGAAPEPEPEPAATDPALPQDEATPADTQDDAAPDAVPADAPIATDPAVPPAAETPSRDTVEPADDPAAPVPPAAEPGATPPAAVTPEADQPAPGAAPAQAPAMPEDEAQAAAPDSPPADTAPAPASASAAPDNPAPEPDVAADTPDQLTAEPEPPVTDETPASAPAIPPTAPAPATPQAATSPQASVAEVPAPVPAEAPAEAPATPEAPQDPPVAPADLPRIEAMPSGAIGVAVRRGAADSTPLAGLGRTVEGVTTGRLPSIGAAPTPGATPETAPPPEDLGDLSLPAYLRNAARVDLEPGTPRLGLVLTDAPGAEAALAALPFAVTVALDPYAEGAPERAATYRDAGHEVVLLATGFPPLATPSDIAVILDAWARQFPRVIGLMDPAENGVADSRALARELALMLEPEGFGVIARRAGFDTFLQSARGAGLAATGLYRTLDDAGQSAITIRRLIDRAAFEAERQSGILIAGSAGNADTLAALTAYATDGRGAVPLVPASAVLTPE